MVKEQELYFEHHPTKANGYYTRLAQPGWIHN